MKEACGYAKERTLFKKWTSVQSMKTMGTLMPA
jgi:hypothetical protein